MISGRHRPISSAPSVRPMEKALGSSSPPATARPWRFIWKKSRLRSRPTRMRSFFSIRRDGMSRRSFLSQTTSPSCRCRRNRLSSTRWKISGSSCATTGSPTGSSNLMTTSSITVALPGTSSSICRGKSSPSEPETGPIGHDHQDLVLGASYRPKRNRRRRTDRRSREKFFRKPKFMERFPPNLCFALGWL